MALWKGLGYYSRARNLQKAAQIIVNENGGELPQNAKEWAALPGIGPYTAAAISSICFGEPVAVVDGNVQRVMSRLFDIEHAVDRKEGKESVQEACDLLLDATDPGSSNQAWMELGALVCAPRSPLCGECPLSDGCLAYERNTVLQRPVKQPKKAALPVEVGFSIALRKEQNGPLQWWVERRPDSGIWSQLEAFPCTMTPQRLGEEADINIGLFGNQSPERQMVWPCETHPHTPENDGLVQYRTPLFSPKNRGPLGRCRKRRGQLAQTHRQGTSRVEGLDCEELRLF